jgi:hypothetical protein
VANTDYYLSTAIRLLEKKVRRERHTVLDKINLKTLGNLNVKGKVLLNCNIKRMQGVGLI